MLLNGSGIDSKFSSISAFVFIRKEADLLLGLRSHFRASQWLTSSVLMEVVTHMANLREISLERTEVFFSGFPWHPKTDQEQ